MTFENFWSSIVSTIKPIKTIFAFYVLLYLFPLAFFLLIGYETSEKLFIDNTDEVNVEAAIILAICGICIVSWTAFFLIYFTKERTKNPHLYKKGFISDYSVKDE